MSRRSALSLVIVAFGCGAPTAATESTAPPSPGATSTRAAVPAPGPFLRCEENGDQAGTTYVFDGRGLVVEEETDGEAGPETVSYERDARGRVIRRIRRDDYGLHQVYEHAYEERGGALVERITAPDGVARGLETREHTYDDMGRRVRTDHLDEDGAVTHTTECSWDAEGRLIRRARRSDGLRLVEEWSYGPDGDLSAISRVRNGERTEVPVREQYGQIAIGPEHDTYRYSRECVFVRARDCARGFAPPAP